MTGPYIDLHCHVLPAYDDGAIDLDTALAMLRLAQEDGIVTLVATPHCIPGSNVFPLEKARERHQDLCREAQTAGLSIRIEMGQEVLLEGPILETLQHGHCLPLGASRTVLVEFPLGMEAVGRHADEMQRLVLDGWVPLLAHLERYEALRGDDDTIEALVDAGCRIQVNAGSILGLFGRTVQKQAVHLLDAGWVHVVASDAHSVGRRRPALSEADRWLTGRYGTAHARTLLHDNPLALLEDRPVTAPLTTPLDEGRLWRFLRRLKAGREAAAPGENGRLDGLDPMRLP